MSDTKPQAVTAAEFDNAVLAADRPVLVDFWAPWCGPCRQIAPTLDELAAAFEGRADIRKVNVDDHQDLAARFGIRSIPTLIVFHNGEPVETLTGVQPANTLSEALERQLQAGAKS